MLSVRIIPCLDVHGGRVVKGIKFEELRDARGQALAVSQFTLLADFSKGNRPSFNGAAKPESAKVLFDLFVQELSILLDQPVPTGVFGADMKVELTNDGPVTVVLE